MVFSTKNLGTCKFIANRKINPLTDGYGAVAFSSASYDMSWSCRTVVDLAASTGLGNPGRHCVYRLDKEF
jgi:hypothetical protein